MTNSRELLEGTHKDENPHKEGRNEMEEYLLVFDSSKKCFRPRKMSNEINHTNLRHDIIPKFTIYENTN